MSASSKKDLQKKRDDVLQLLLAHVESNQSLLVLKAPPGSGKTYVTTRAVALARHRGRRVAVATQTNAQAEDFCRRMAHEFPRFTVHRWASAGRRERDLGASVRWHRGRDLPQGPCVVVATSAKWGTSDLDGQDAFDLLFIDEAWQLCWADFMLFGAVASRFVLVGDPGQIPPVVPIDVSRWQTSRRPPHVPAPEVILRDRTLPTRRLELPVSTRLPHDTCALVQAFYDFRFESWSAPGERRLVLPTANGDDSAADRVLERLGSGSTALLALPTPAGGPPLEEDIELARAAVSVVRRALTRHASAQTEDGVSALSAEDIGISATHRVMNTRLADALGEFAGKVRVDTPERWQGLERPLMVVVHPLSGVTHPTVFDLATGRLCVMTSRHRVGVVLVSRDHVGTTLEQTLPRAEQCLGQRDEAGRGRAQHRAVWDHLHANDRVVRA